MGGVRKMDREIYIQVTLRCRVQPILCLINITSQFLSSFHPCPNTLSISTRLRETCSTLTAYPLYYSCSSMQVCMLQLSGVHIKKQKRVATATCVKANVLVSLHSVSTARSSQGMRTCVHIHTNRHTKSTIPHGSMNTHTNVECQ